MLVSSLGPDVSATTAALRSNAVDINDVLSRRMNNLALLTNYDCTSFSAAGICVSVQLRYSNFDAMNEGAGVLTAAYRLTDQTRVGSFIDYRAREQEPTGLRFSSELPIFGAFLAFSQHRDGTGWQGKILGAVQRGNVTITRDSSVANTEPGSGKSDLSSHLVFAETGFGVSIAQGVTATPFAGIRYSEAGRGSYRENAVTGAVTYPVSYDAHALRATTATAGLRINGMFTDRLGYIFGAGVEHDLRQQAGNYSGTSAIVDLERFSLPGDSVKNRIRAFGSVGLSYNVNQNQRLTGNVSLRNDAYSGQVSTTVMGGWQAAF